MDRTTYLAGADQMDANLISVLEGWIINETANLTDFIANPAEHVNYNPYIILDYTALNNRLSMLQQVSGALDVIVQYKKGNPNYDVSMYQTALDGIPSIIFGRLLEWMNLIYAQMTQIVQSNGDPNNISPLADYVGMFTFDTNKFMTDYDMYANTIAGCQAVVEYKTEQGA